MKKIWAYILPTVLCFVLGGLAGWLQHDAINEWYPLLDKPALTPPNAVFPIAWSIIYLCMGISGGLVLTSEAPARKSAVRLWFFQLGCNSCGASSSSSAAARCWAWRTSWCSTSW